jgi:hypothetical protein
MSTTLTARTTTRTASTGQTVYGEPFLFAEGIHGGHTIEVWKQERTQFLGDSIYRGEESQVVIDGEAGYAAPRGTAKQVLAKLAAKLDERRDNAELIGELTRLVSRDETGTVYLDDAPSVGSVVMVYAMGSYRQGVVVKVTATQATVAYTTASSGGRVFRKADKHSNLRVRPGRGVSRPAAEAVAAETPAEATVVTEDAPAAPAVAETKAYRIGKLLREFVLASDDDGHHQVSAALVEHVASRNVCYDGTATLRLTPAFAEELINAASAMDAEAKAAARAARRTLYALFS